MMLGRIAIVAAACGMFWLGHARGGATTRIAVAASARPAPTPFAEVTRSMRRVMPVDPSLGIALAEARNLAASPVGNEVRATIHETAPQREARHQYLTDEAERLKPDLPAEKLASLLAVSDRNEERFREARAKFMLGDLNEDDYVTALKQVVRDGVDQTKAFLSPDEFATLEGNPDYDPFDPDAAPVEGQAPYLTRAEEQAMDVDRGRDSPTKPQ